MKILTKIFTKIFANPVKKIRRYTEYLLTHPAAPELLVLFYLKQPVLYRREAAAAICELDFLAPAASLALVSFRFQGKTRYAWSTQYMNGQVLIVLGSSQILFASHMEFDFIPVAPNDSVRLPLPQSAYYATVCIAANGSDICVTAITDATGRTCYAYSPQREPNWDCLCFRAECL